MSAHQLTEPLLNADDAARLLRVPRSTLYELVRSRGLPHVKVGRALRFTREDLAFWLAENSYGRGAPRQADGLSGSTIGRPSGARLPRQTRRGTELDVGSV